MDRGARKAGWMVETRKGLLMYNMGIHGVEILRLGGVGMSEYKKWSRLHVALSTWRYGAFVMVFHTL